MTADYSKIEWVRLQLIKGHKVLNNLVCQVQLLNY